MSTGRSRLRNSTPKIVQSASPPSSTTECTHALQTAQHASLHGITSKVVGSSIYWDHSRTPSAFVAACRPDVARAWLLWSMKNEYDIRIRSMCKVGELRTRLVPCPQTRLAHHPARLRAQESFAFHLALSKRPGLCSGLALLDALNFTHHLCPWLGGETRVAPATRVSKTTRPPRDGRNSLVSTTLMVSSGPSVQQIRC